MFYTVCDRERLRCLTVVLDLYLHTFMELFHHGNELPWAAILGHDPAQALATDSVEGLGQMDVGGEQVGVLLLTFLLKLPCSKHRVYGPALLPTSTLTFWKESLVEVYCETVDQDPGEYPVMERNEMSRWFSQD